MPTRPPRRAWPEPARRTTRNLLGDAAGDGRGFTEVASWTLMIGMTVSTAFPAGYKHGYLPTHLVATCAGWRPVVPYRRDQTLQDAVELMIDVEHRLNSAAARDV